MLAANEGDDFGFVAGKFGAKEGEKINNVEEILIEPAEGFTCAITQLLLIKKKNKEQNKKSSIEKLQRKAQVGAVGAGKTRQKIMLNDACAHWLDVFIFLQPK